MTHSILTTLPNGVRVLAMPMPQMRSASAGVFVHTGSRNESPSTNGLSHFLEHMAFKGTTTRDVQAINFDAERLGMDMNAYTCKETTAYHMSGLGRHAEAMLTMLADIVCNATLPALEVERERQVITQEATEYAEDSASVSNDLVDQACYGSQAMGMPIVCTAENIARLTRDDLAGYVRRQYTGPNVIVACAGNIDVDACHRIAETVFAGVRPGAVHPVAPARHIGGVSAQAMPGISQVYANIAFPIDSVLDGADAGLLAATLFGGGFSSPLYDQVRERLGLAYQIGCTPYVGDNYGSFVIDAVTTPEQLPALFGTTARLLAEHAAHIDGRHIERARNQLRVARVMRSDDPWSAMESAVTELLTQGRVIGTDEALQRIDTVGADDIRRVFERMLRATPAIGLAGQAVSPDVAAAFEAALR
jgi:predicted Zn-dependent peptidase